MTRTIMHPLQRTLRALLCGLLVTVCLGGWPAASALAQSDGASEPGPSAGEVSRLTTELSNEIYSPFCPGKTLMMCPSPNAAKVRRDIQRMVREGKTKPEIKEQVLETHGEEFRIVEPPTRDNAMLLVVLVLGLMLAIAAVVLLSRKRTDDTEIETPAPASGQRGGRPPRR